MIASTRTAVALIAAALCLGAGAGAATAATPEGCVVSDPPNPGFSNPCWYTAGDSGMYAATGDWELRVRRGSQTLVRSSEAGDPDYDTSFIRAGDVVTVRALSKGSSITVGNPFPAQNHPSSAWFVPPHVTESHQTVSFDGTRIAWRLWLPAGTPGGQKLPVIVGWPGWGGTSAAFDPAADPATAWELSTGYAVAAIDPRGFGGSGGQAELDSVDYEGRDVSAIIDDLGRDPRIVKDGPDDPRVGMIGGSYGGAIQLVAASRDPRIDAITPDDTWNDLVTALLPDGVFRMGWVDLLSSTGAESAYVGSASLGANGADTGGIDPMIPRAAAEGTAAGKWSPAVREWFGARGLSSLLGSVHAPTLLLHGEHDTLFAPSQAATTYRELHSADPSLPLHVVLYCGGHGTCSPDQQDYEQYDRIDSWFRRWLKGDTTVDLGPTVEYVTQDGVHHTAAQYPVPAHPVRTTSSGGLVAVNGEPNVGGGADPTGAVDPALSSPLGQPQQPEVTSLKIPLPVSQGIIAGRPAVTLTWRAWGRATDEPRRVPLFFRLIDLRSDEVLDNQETPHLLLADGSRHTATFGLESVEWQAAAHDRLALEIDSSSGNFEPYRGAALVSIDRAGIEVPVVGQSEPGT